MGVKFERIFYKDLSKVNNKKLAQQVLDVISEFETAKNLIEITGLKKLTGHRSAYRKRIGDFRIGFFYENNTIELTRLPHRKEIYKFFP